MALENAKKRVKKDEQAADNTATVEATLSPVEYKKPAPSKTVEKITFEGRTYQLTGHHDVKKSGNSKPLLIRGMIKKGDLVKIEAKGKVRFGALAGSATPDGFPNGLYQEYNDVPSMNHGALYGGIRNDDGKGFKMILFGRQKTFIAEKTGGLLILINDKDIQNNTGYFEINIKRYTLVE